MDCISHATRDCPRSNFPVANAASGRGARTRPENAASSPACASPVAGCWMQRHGEQIEGNHASSECHEVIAVSQRATDSHLSSISAIPCPLRVGKRALASLARPNPAPNVRYRPIAVSHSTPRWRDAMRHRY